MILTALLLATVTATFNPPSPKVGDLITIDFAAPVVLDESRDFEVVSRRGARVVVRTFAPKPFVLSGVVGGKVRFTNLIVPVGSVLRQGDDLKPAPLAPPVEIAWPRMPFVAIAIAAACALLAWAAVWWRSRRELMVAPQIVIAPDERFRRAVLSLRENASHPNRWAALADETRAYLAATRPQLGSELTTTELVPRLAGEERVVIDILNHGDYEKFAPEGTPVASFEDVAARALESLARQETRSS
jgi:hypothetical protein